MSYSPDVSRRPDKKPPRDSGLVNLTYYYRIFTDCTASAIAHMGLSEEEALILGEGPISTKEGAKAVLPCILNLARLLPPN